MTGKDTMVIQSRWSAMRGSAEQAGFTLIELMVGMVVGVIVVVAAFTILTTTSKSLRANEQIVDTQQNARMAMEWLARDLKLAGFGSPGVPIGNCSNGIVPSDQTATGVDSGPDSVQVLVPTSRNVWFEQMDLEASDDHGGNDTDHAPAWSRG